MDHAAHGLPVSSGSTGVDALAMVLRLVLLLGTAVVAGAGILRPLVTETTGRFRLAVGALAGVSAVVALISIAVLQVSPVAAIAHAVLTLAVPVLLRWPPVARWVSVGLLILLIAETSLGRSGIGFAVDTAYVAASAAFFGLALLSLTVPAAQWRDSGPRLGPLALSLGGLLVLTGAIQLGISGVGFDRRLYQTGFGVAVLAALVLPLVVTILLAVLPTQRSADDARRGYRLGVAGVLIGFAAWSVAVALPTPADLPVPGVALLSSVSAGGPQTPVLVSPQRPGANLVHFPASAGPGLEVAGADGKFVRATERPGAQGTWAEVTLPRGRSEVTVRRGGAESGIDVDTGDLAAARSTVDGPECASAALGGLVSGRKLAATGCPSDRLSTTDAGALRGLVGYLGQRKTPGITLISDDSPRGRAAAALVRERAAAEHLRVDAGPRPNNALITVSGWARAYQTMTDAARRQRETPTYAYGLYLAPWLLNGPIANSVASSASPLSFDPREPDAVSFASALANAFGGENPSLGGFRQWRGQYENKPVQIYSAAQVNWMPMDPSEPHAIGMPMDRPWVGQWIPQATVVPISNALSQSRVAALETDSGSKGDTQ